MSISTLIIDDEPNWIVTLKNILLDYDICCSNDIFSAKNLHDAFEILHNNFIDIIFLDLNLNNESGQDAICRFRNECPDATIVIMSGITYAATSISCIEKGAFDYLPKAMSTEELVLSINKVVKNVVINRAKYSNVNSEEFSAFSSYITQDEKIFKIFEYLKIISSTDHSILITGESGVGKGVLAKSIAEFSRPDSPFVALNVAGLDEQMFSDTLFGHIRGAYTNASSSRIGMIAKAENGTLFLDEIGDISISQQIKLLYLTQNGEYQKIGSDVVDRTNAKLIFATNQDLMMAVNSGRFRSDLFYRLSTHHIHIPPLRERTGDIPLLIRHFIKLASVDYNVNEPRVSDSVMTLLKQYSFPGNIRELRSIVYNAVLKCDGEVLTFSDFSFSQHEAFESRYNDEHNELAERNSMNLDNLLDDKILEALKISNGNQSKAANLLGISQSTISRRLRKLQKEK